jgi:hypothetical protein
MRSLLYSFENVQGPGDPCDSGIVRGKLVSDYCSEGQVFGVENSFSVPIEHKWRAKNAKGRHASRPI